MNGVAIVYLNHIQLRSFSSIKCQNRIKRTHPILVCMGWKLGRSLSLCLSHHFTEFLQHKLSKQSIMHIPHPCLQGTNGHTHTHTHWHTIYSQFRDKLSVPRELILLVGCCPKTSPTAELGAWRKEQLPLHTSEWKFQLFRRKITPWVTKGLLRITPMSSSIYLDRLGNKQVVLQHMYLDARGNAKNLKNFCLKNKVGAALHTIHMIPLR